MNMKQVWKYKINPADGRIEMPVGAKVLSVAFQGQDLCLWALVDPGVTIKKERYFAVFGTGHDIYDDAGFQFLGTAFVDNLVFHVFEIL